MVVLLTAVVVLPSGLAGSSAGAAAAPGSVAAAAGPIAYPDLVSVIPAEDLSILQTPTGKEFNYTHVIYNAGPGPLEVQPVNYNPTTNLADGVQKIYSYDSNGGLVLEQSVPVPDQFFFHAAHEHFHFPLASFGLYAVKADGTIGQPVALSPKNGFCIAESLTLDPSRAVLPRYDGNCGDPTALRAIGPGVGDLYNRADPGQSIDITGVADGTYWFHTVADPNQNFVDGDRSNNTTDIKVKISGNTVTPLSALKSQGNFVVDQSAVVNGIGQVSTPPLTTAFSDELFVATVSADGGGSPQTATVSGGGLNWTLAKRSNGATGTAEVWTAMATTPVSNAVIRSTTSTSALQSLTVHTIKGAAGIGATSGGSASSGAPSTSLTTTKPGSWVMAVGNDPSHWLQRALPPGQQMMSEWISQTVNTSAWLQGSQTPIASGGTVVTANSTYPDADPWNQTQFEIVPSAQTDFTGPVISSPSAANIGPDHADVRWVTDEAATTQVAYGPTTAYGQTTALDPTLVTNHDTPVTGLTPQTTYFCELRSRDAAGNLTQQGGFSFTTTPPRTTPAVFSDVRVTDIQPDQATVAWTTDENADSQVEYGTTTAYGSASVRNPNMVTSHFIVVNNLLPATTYHFRVNGTDAYGNSGASGDFTFTTPAIPPQISIDKSVSVDGRGTVNTPGLTTAEAGELLVAFVSSDGPTNAQQTATVSGGGLTWTLARRTNAQYGTSEVWSAKATSIVTNAAIRSTPLTAGFDQSLTVVAFKGAAGIGNSVSANASTGPPTATMSTTRASSLIYGVGNDWDSATARTLGTGQAMVHQWVDSAVGDTFWTQARTAPAGPVESVVTLGATAPTTDRWNFTMVEIARPVSIPATAPVVSGVAVTAIGTTSATVTWSTDVPSSSQVAYGPTTSYGSTSALDPTLVTSHSVTLTGLTPGALYHFKATSANSIGPGSSGDGTFTTLTSVAPPVVSGVAVTSITPTTATIVWTTDVASNSQVAYGPTAAYGSTTPLDPALVTSHSVTLTGLTSGSTYHYKVTSANAGGPTSSGDGSFTTVTVDSTPPTVSAVTPPNGSTGNPTNAVISATFSEAVQPASIAMSVRTSTNVGVAGTVAYNATTRVATFTPTGGLAYNTVYVGTISTATDLAGNPMTAAANWLFATGPPPATNVAADRTVFQDGRNTVTTPAFTTTAASEVLLAFVAADGPTSGGQTATVTGGGLTWTLVRRANAQAGTSEVWKATTSAVLTNATVRAALSKTGFDVSLTVVTFSGASGVGASAGASRATGAPSVSLTTTAVGSRVYGVGNDWDSATARTVGAGQSMVHQWVDSAVGDTFWTQCANAATATAGTVVTLNDTAPTGNRSNFVAVEIIP